MIAAPWTPSQNRSGIGGYQDDLFATNRRAHDAPPVPQHEVGQRIVRAEKYPIRSESGRLPLKQPGYVVRNSIRPSTTSGSPAWTARSRPRIWRPPPGPLAGSRAGPISSRSGFCSPRFEAGGYSRCGVEPVDRTMRRLLVVGMKAALGADPRCRVRRGDVGPAVADQIAAPPRSARPITSRSNSAETRSPPGNSGERVLSPFIPLGRIASPVTPIRRSSSIASPMHRSRATDLPASAAESSALPEISHTRPFGRRVPPALPDQSARTRVRPSQAAALSRPTRPVIPVRSCDTDVPIVHTVGFGPLTRPSPPNVGAS